MDTMPLSNFRLMIETTIFSSVALEGALESCSRCGFKDIEIGLTHFDACSATRSDTRQLDESLTLNGLAIGALFALPGWEPFKRVKNSLGLASPVEKDRASSVKQMRRALAVARDLGCHDLVSEFSGDMDDQKASRRAFIRSIGDILPDLEANGMRVFFEAHPGDFIEDSFDAVQLLTSFDSDSVGYNYCMAHTFSLRHSPKEIIENAKSILGYLHVADTLKPERIFFAPTYTPKVKPHLHMVPGEGDVDFREAFESLESTDFEGYLSIQPFSSFDAPERAAKRSKSRILQLLAGSKRRSA
jgi:sugar phosphate isomerase/epimerase